MDMVVVKVWWNFWVKFWCFLEPTDSQLVLTMKIANSLGFPIQRTG